MANKQHYTKEFLSLDDQVSLLESRGIKVNDRETAKMHLIRKNYFDLINGFESLMLKDRKAPNKEFKPYYFEDFLFLYKFDKELNRIILESLDSFESKLKSAMAHRFSEAYFVDNSTAACYLEKNNYINPLGRNYPYNFLPSDIKYNLYPTNPWKNHDFFKSYRINTNTNVDYIEYCQNKYEFLRSYQVPPLWMIIKVATLGSVFKLLIAYEKDILEKVMEDLNFDKNKKNEFFTFIRVFIELRNTCAHFQLVNRFRTPNNIRFTNNMISYYKLHTKRNAHNFPTNYVIKLYDTLLILREFENLGRVSKLIKETYFKANSKRQRDLFMEILERMGRRKISEWDIFKAKK